MKVIEITIDGKKYTSDTGVQMVTPIHEQTKVDYPEDLEVRVVMNDEDGLRYMAEFIVPHNQVLMSSDQKEYFDFIVLRQVPTRYINESNLYDIIKIDTNLVATGNNLAAEPFQSAM